MTSEPGLRERKKQRTHTAISEAAVELFLRHGFDQVSVAQVAEAAEVSRRTLFAYFPAKEDLVVHRFADHEAELGQVVRARPAGMAPLEALRVRYLDALARRDPITGLNDLPPIVALYRMVLETPALVARMYRFQAGAERALADALRETAAVGEFAARLAAVQIVAVHWMLMLDNARLLAAGEAADERYAGAANEAEQAFALLANGVGRLGAPGVA
ncbi:TetR family transcriptional regulator [Nonomuraea guangzhouensis]|uniref:TetR family transcriptional regulator n=1 Tax=Nonomuraea guangzhouensis TaxID=1291555 RepID=A0ABW4GNB8_9ACTN|nr:TetR family transcriptional regulator [Nonomuraea guangzhouensis]